MVASAFQDRTDEHADEAPVLGQANLLLTPVLDIDALDVLCEQIRERVEQAVREGITCAVENVAEPPPA